MQGRRLFICPLVTETSDATYDLQELCVAQTEVSLNIASICLVDDRLLRENESFMDTGWCEVQRDWHPLREKFLAGS